MAAAAAFAANPNLAEAPHFATDTAALYGRASQVEAPKGADVIIVEDEESFVFDAEGGMVHSRYLLYKVLTQRGAETWGDISMGWEPWHEERPEMRARVITLDNIAHVLDAATFTDAPAKENQEHVFSDRRVMRAPLPAIAPGSLVEEELTSKQRPPFSAAGTSGRIYFGAFAPVEHARVVLDAPSSLPLRYRMELLTQLQPQRAEREGRVRTTFEAGPLEALEEAAPELPSDVSAYPNVAFSTGGSWRQIAEEYGRIVDRQIAGAELKPLAAKLIAGKKTREDRVSAILQYLDREVRYTGIEFGDAAIVPHSPNETLTHKYGDCKDKASVLVAMLRSVEIPAYVALLNAGDREDLAPDLPGMSMFDHAIVFVPGPPDLWIDATDDYARLGQVPVQDQDRLALIARAGTDALVRTPTTSSPDNALIEKREILLAENGPAHIIETSQPHGSDESSYRRSYADKESKEAREELTNYVKAEYLAEKLDRMDRSDPKDLSRQFELILESDRAKRGYTDLDVAVTAIRLEGLFERLPSDLRQKEKKEEPQSHAGDSSQKPKTRTADYELYAPFVTEWQYRIVPPTGFRPKPLPKNEKLSLGPAILTEEFAADQDGVVRATIRFDTVKRRLTVAEADTMRAEVEQLRGAEPILIYFEPVGQTLLADGKVREALQSYRDLIGLHPKEAVHHLQMAETLLTAGLGEAARAEAQTAVKLESNSALAEKTLASILEYDRVGRNLRPDSDYAGAEAAWRAAAKLDPADKAIVANLALLLEYNSWGLRYGPGAKLEEAIATYRSLTPDERADFGLQNNLAYALFYAGEFSEARKDAETLNPQPDALIVACEAALNGPQAGLAEARKRTGGEEPFRRVAEAAGRMLANLRKYPLAADLEEAGASGDNASETAAFAATYRKTQPHEQLALADDAAGTAMRFELLTDDPNLSLEKLLSVTSRNGGTGLATQEVLEALVKAEKGLLSRKARGGLFADIGLDISLTNAQPKVQGNDASGYKVTLWPSARYKSAVYVVKEEGKYRVLGTSRWYAGVGLEALDRVTAHDVAGARILLDWVREDHHLGGGDDPLAGAIFPRVWTKGQEGEAGTVKLAAAAILIHFKPTAARGIPVLEAALNSGPDEATQVSIKMGLVEGYEKLEEHAKAVTLTSALAAQYPQSSVAFVSQATVLRALGRFEEADGIANERLKRMPGDLDAMHVLVMNATGQEDYGKAQALTQKIVDAGQGEAEDLSNLAWYSLFTGTTGPSQLEHVLKASQLSKDNYGLLHTLGCVYAELGKTKEAREVLIQAMDLADLDEPDPNFWYAFGRIAEQYGEREVAMANYQRVTKPEEADQVPGSAYRLAQMRLQALRTAGQASVAGPKK